MSRASWISFSILVVFSAGLMGMAPKRADSADQRLAMLCQQAQTVGSDWRLLDESAQLALDSLRPWREAIEARRAAVREQATRVVRKTGRGLASATVEQPIRYEEPPFSAVDREFWEKWARERLKRAQELNGSIQSVRDHTHFEELQTEVSGMNESLVKVHGYASLGRWAELSRSIQALQKHSERARALACSTGS